MESAVLYINDLVSVAAITRFMLSNHYAQLRTIWLHFSSKEQDEV